MTAFQAMKWLNTVILILSVVVIVAGDGHAVSFGVAMFALTVTFHVLLTIMDEQDRM